MKKRSVKGMSSFTFYQKYVYYINELIASTGGRGGDYMFNQVNENQREKKRSREGARVKDRLHRRQGSR